MKSEAKKRTTFSVEDSIIRARAIKTTYPKWKLTTEGQEFVWTSQMDRVKIIRTGVPYASIEVISDRINVPVKEMLDLFGMPQTTYNKKRREKSLLNGRDSEVILLLTELLDFGSEVFNHEVEKFQRWMKKSNISLGNNSPESLLDTITGIHEVRNCLNRIEFGNLA